MSAKQQKPVARRRRPASIPRGGGSVPRIRRSSSTRQQPQPSPPPVDATRRPAPAPRDVPRLGPLEPEVALYCEVTYSQVPGELADKFEATARIEPRFGSLIRASAVLYAIRALLEQLGAQNLLAPAAWEVELDRLSPAERDRL